MPPRDAAALSVGRREGTGNFDDALNVSTKRTARAARAWRVVGEVFPGCPGRHQPLVIVRRCPSCSGTHGHRGLGLRRAGCGTEYVVVAEVPR